MPSCSRRAFMALGLMAPAWRSIAAGNLPDTAPGDVHDQILEIAAAQEAVRRARFAKVKTASDLGTLQDELRVAFHRVIGGLPERDGPPPSQLVGTIDGGDYLIEKRVYESLPGYFVSALLYRPKGLKAPAPAVLSPCGHSAVGKAEGIYQILHINLAKRGYIVMTYDPVGQGERSQFWDAERNRSRFNLSCGEHAVLGNPLYLIGMSLARYRIWDGIRGIDYLAARPEVDASRIGCVGNSGGGNLTAYIGAIDPRVTVSAICCYITALRRRMGNRIAEDPSADPEQDPFGLVSEGIDHAGLLALRVPRPTLLGAARRDFFPIEGTRETLAEAKALFEAAGAGDHIACVEADARHGLSPTIRLGVYGWFDRWLMGRPATDSVAEVTVTPRPPGDLLVAADGQVNRTFHSRPLLPLALEEVDRRRPPRRGELRDILRLDPELAAPRIAELSGGERPETLVVLVNGSEAPDWRQETQFLERIKAPTRAVVVVDPRGVATARPRVTAPGLDYTDPISGIEENLAYNAFLVGKSLVGMRVTDVLRAVETLRAKQRPQRIVVCGRRDAALIACLAAAIEPSITHVAAEEMRMSLRPLFAPQGTPINAAAILPNLLRDFGDIPDVLARIAPRPLLLAAGVGDPPHRDAPLKVIPAGFTQDPSQLTAWLEG